MILIAGWSLFTILQDFYHIDEGRYTNYSVVGKGKQYLPLNPQNYSGQRKYPVYKPSYSASSQMKQSNVNGKVSLSNVHDKDLLINEINYDVQYRNGSGKSSLNAGNITDNKFKEVARTTPVEMSRMALPFSKSMNIDAKRDIADASIPSTSNGYGSSASVGSGMMRAFGNGEEGDAIEGGGGTENQYFYNDVPVGDGYFLLMIMSLLYFFYKAFRKNKDKHTTKTQTITI
jgi:hypothetical protein